MTLLSSVSTPARAQPRKRHGYLVLISLSTAIGATAIAVVSYILWPTWTSGGADGPAQLPVSIGTTLFNVPTSSVRVKMQQHSGPQERIDLSFTYALREARDTPARIGPRTSPSTVEETPQSTQVIFLSIAAHNGALAPEERIQTIYPRYLVANTSRVDDGLSQTAFRDNTPYANEDLFIATSPRLTARCTRDNEIPGMCLSESRLEGADLTFRFPRSWLTDWRNVTDAMNRIVTLIYKPR